MPEEKTLWPRQKEEEPMETDKEINANLSINWQEIPMYEGIPQDQFTGERVSIDSILNKTVGIIDFRTQASQFFEGDYCYIQFLDADNNLAWTTTGSKVLISQLNELRSKHKLPVRAVITKKKRYYTLKKPE